LQRQGALAVCVIIGVLGWTWLVLPRRIEDTEIYNMHLRLFTRRTLIT
jgi:hypothetical protein